MGLLRAGSNGSHRCGTGDGPRESHGECFEPRHRSFAAAGRGQGYLVQTKDIPGIRGKLDLSATIKANVLVRARTVCQFDELSVNVLGKSYYVALLRAADIRAAGMDVVPKPLPDDPGHAEIPELTYENRKSKQAIEWRTLLAEKLFLQIEGPFSSRE